MKYVNQSVLLLLTGSDQPTVDELQIAIAIAESMICELSSAVGEWELTLKELNAWRSKLNETAVN
jgi:hypothetical protein